MNCADCHAAILDAEPAELLGRGNGELARHLRDCPRCRSAANAIVADTRVLARLVALDSGTRATRRRVAIAGLAAAGIVLVLGARAISSRVPHPADARPIAPAASHVAITGAAESSATVARSPEMFTSEKTGSREAFVAERHIPAVAFQPAAFEAVPIRNASSPEPTDSAPVITVRPHGGRRAAVFKVAQSNVTVVWLY